MIETININKLKRVVEIIDKIPLFDSLDDTIMDLTTIRRMTKDVIWSLECSEEEI